MYKPHLSLLCCPKCRGDLQAQITTLEQDFIKEGLLTCPRCACDYPIIGFIPRFVPFENYASSFGFEWQMHKKTQYDSYTGLPLSKKRFYEETRWHPSSGDSCVILEAGCGAGRFSAYALEVAGKEGLVVSFDYSQSVEVSLENNGLCKNLLLMQASIQAIPIRSNVIDKCFCFGVLQFTPSSKDSIQSLVNILKPGGELVCDHFPLTKKAILNTRYYVRPITKRLPHKMLYNFGRWYIDTMWPLFELNHKIFSPKWANFINWRLLLPDYSSSKLSKDKLKEWAYLDFFNMLSPTYDRLISRRTFYAYLIESGLSKVEINMGYNGFEGRGYKPKASLESDEALFGDCKKDKNKTS